jgi:hypothetical protein
VRSIPVGRGVIVVDVPGAGAAAVSRRRSIVISRTLEQALSPRELAVVLAHERAHQRHRHGGYVLVGSIIGTLVPWLRPAVSRLRYLLERWADEDAASAVGDRTLVARTIARASLLDRVTPALAVPAFHDGATVDRVRAMLLPAPPRPIFAEVVAFGGTTVATTGMAGSTLQLHHALLG